MQKIQHKPQTPNQSLCGVEDGGESEILVDPDLLKAWSQGDTSQSIFHDFHPSPKSYLFITLSNFPVMS